MCVDFVKRNKTIVQRNDNSIIIKYERLFTHELEETSCEKYKKKKHHITIISIQNNNNCMLKTL